MTGATYGAIDSATLGSSHTKNYMFLVLFDISNKKGFTR